VGNIKTGENSYRILLALSEGDRRFSELVQEVKRASLAKELTQLEKMKYVTRTVADTKPPTTTYSLTKLGKDFLRSEAEKHIPKLEVELERLKAVLPEKVKQIKGNL
jgi:DNA-binding HxlR family transcriptional regulator